VKQGFDPGFDIEECIITAAIKRKYWRKQMKLGVNIDHVATLRNARSDVYPNLISAAQESFSAGADGITIHLREDRRHVKDEDVVNLRQKFKTRFLNLEMALNDEIAEIALKIKPNAVCLVPERRQEVTTEGGLDVAGNLSRVITLVKAFKMKNIEVSLFIAPDKKQIDAAKQSGAPTIELHTGEYGEVSDNRRLRYNKQITGTELKKLIDAARYAKKIGLKVNAGHGLTYTNVKAIAKYRDIFSELNIGHNIVARAVFVGLKQAVREMKALLK
jgi:pyridoxine 5-phosphate synthase